MRTEDIEDREIFKNKIELIEEYKFDEIIKKYDLESNIIFISHSNKMNTLSSKTFGGNKFGGNTSAEKIRLKKFGENFKNKW